MITTTTTTIYPPLPALAPRAAGETAEGYGLRALLFIATERITATVDDDGLALAAHVFRLAVDNRALTTVGAERLAELGRMITVTQGWRLAAGQAATPAQPAAEASTVDRPNAGPMAPLSPAPAPQTPPSAAGTAPAGRRKAPAVPAVPAVPAFVPPVRLAPVGPAAVDAGELF